MRTAYILGACCFLTTLCLVGISGAAASPPQQGEDAKAFFLASNQPSPTDVQNPVPDCAANSVFLTSRILDVDTSYSTCLDLLPINANGNSALEVKRALERLNFAVESAYLTPADVSTLETPAILWEPAGQVAGLKPANAIGHFKVVRPVGHDLFQTIDFPLEPTVFKADEWARCLTDNKIDRVIALKCRRVQRASLQLDDAASVPALSPQQREPNVVVKVDDQTHGSPLAQIQVGDVAEGRTVKACVRLENHTSHALVIDKIDWQCTCTSITATAQRLASGDSCDVLMDVSFVQRYGPFQASGLVRFDEASHVPPLQLNLTGTAHARWNAEPNVIDLGRVDPTTAPVARNVSISPTAYANGKLVTRAVSKSQAVACELKTPAMDATTKLHVVFDPRLATGTFVGQVHYFCGDETQAANMIEVRAQVESLVAITPSQLLLHLNASESSTADLAFVSRDGRDIKLISAESSLPDVSVMTAAGPASVGTSIANGRPKPLRSTVTLTGHRAGPTAGQIEFRFSIDGRTDAYRVLVPVVIVE